MPARFSGAGMPMWWKSTRAILLTRRGRLTLPALFALLALLVGEELDVQPLDARAVDLDDLEADTVVHDLVADLGGAPEPAEDEACHRVVILERDRPVELLVEIVDRERPVNAQATVRQLLNRFVGQ